MYHGLKRGNVYDRVGKLGKPYIIGLKKGTLFMIGWKVRQTIYDRMGKLIVKPFYDRVGKFVKPFHDQSI